MSKKTHHESSPHKPVEPVTTPDSTLPPPATESGAEPSVIDPKDLEISVLKDRLLRLQADFDNFRKRTIRDREETARRAAERLIQDLIPIVDHFELGLEAARQNHVKHSVIEGFEGILKQFKSNLDKAGVSPIEAKGQPFDPNLHEAVAHLPSLEHPDGSIIEETRKGYKLGNYILRASQVIVSTGPAKEILQDSDPTPQESDPTSQKDNG